MFEMLGAIGGSLIKSIGGLFQQSQGAKDAQAAQNLAFQQSQIAQQDAIPNLVAGAKAAGINPLAALGVSSPGFSAVVNPNSGAAGKAIEDSGSDLGRAVAAMAPAKVRAAELENKLLEAKIANTNADTVQTLKHASDVAKTLGQPGTPPPFPPMPRPDERKLVGDRYTRHFGKPMTEPYVTADGTIVELPTAAASTASQNWMSLPGQVPGAISGIWENVKHGASDLSDQAGSVYGAAKRAVSDYGSVFNTSGY